MLAFERVHEGDERGGSRVRRRLLHERPGHQLAHLRLVAGIFGPATCGLDFAVGMRLHFLIFAALRGTSFAALPYAAKVTGLLEDLEIETPPLGNIGIGQLIASIDHSLGHP